MDPSSRIVTGCCWSSQTALPACRTARSCHTRPSSTCRAPEELRWGGFALNGWNVAFWNWEIYSRAFLSQCVQSRKPHFMMYQNCTASFMWETRAACAVTTTNSKVSFLLIFSSCPGFNSDWGTFTQKLIPCVPELCCGGSKHGIWVQPSAVGLQKWISDNCKWKRVSGEEGAQGWSSFSFNKFTSFAFFH